MWQPGTAHGYHALTYGWLAGEVLRRVDGRTLGRYFAEEIAAPLGLEFWIGLPESEEHRVSTLELAPAPTDPVEIERMQRMYARGANGYRALSLDGVIRMMPENHFNSRALHATEMPGANGITTARSLARMYAACIGPLHGDEVDGVRVSPTRRRAARAERVQGDDLTMLKNTRFAPLLANEAAHDDPEGRSGSGCRGSLGYANLNWASSTGYVMNQRPAAGPGTRARSLNDAVLQPLNQCQGSLANGSERVNPNRRHADKARGWGRPS